MLKVFVEVGVAESIQQALEIAEDRDAFFAVDPEARIEPGVPPWRMHHPGITGPWQVGGRNGTSFADRVDIDADYVRNWSIWLDIVILVRTVRCVLFGREAY